MQETSTAFKFKESELPWFDLDVSKSNYGATEGAYVEGTTLLKISETCFVVVGVCSCLNKEGAQSVARESWGMSGKDRTVSKKTLLSWTK